MLGEAAADLPYDFDRLALFAGLATWLTVYNARTHRFQNAVVGPGAAVALLDLALLHGALLVECSVSCAAVVVLLMGLEFSRPGVIGMGTVKASGLFALFLGYMSAVAVALGLFVAGVHSLLVWRGKRPPHSVAPGPTMLVAALVAIVSAQL